jgi:hypothetical protein
MLFPSVVGSEFSRNALPWMALLICSGWLGCCPAKKPVPAVLTIPKVSLVWAIDDGERINHDHPYPTLMDGKENPVWKPNQPIKLIGLPGETVAFQIVVTGGPTGETGVTVQFDQLQGPTTISNLHEDPKSLWHTIEGFVTLDLHIQRRSGGKSAGESLGWKPRSQPDDDENSGNLADPLVPLSAAPAWPAYPMAVKPGQHRVVWYDITLPSDNLPAGVYRGKVVVRNPTKELGTIPIELEVGSVPLPYAALKSMLFYDPRELRGRFGNDKMIRPFVQMIHRHHLTTIMPLRSAKEIIFHKDELTGAVFKREQGYVGPGANQGPDVIVLGAFGGMKDPDKALAKARNMAKELENLGISDQPGVRDLFLYAVDENCKSEWGPRWRELLRKEEHPLLKAMRIGHTCQEEPVSQPVDLAILPAETYRTSWVQPAEKAGKHVWIYNGWLPHSGSFLTDSWAMSLRANGWIQARYQIERWFYWEATFWDDSNQGGKGTYDPLTIAETFHNQHNDHCNGDGVLTYPGMQTSSQGRSLNYPGVIPSFRLKQWRRGIQDGGYYQLAAKRDPKAAKAIADSVVWAVLEDGKDQRKPGFAIRGADYFHAREKLFRIIQGSK